MRTLSFILTSLLTIPLLTAAAWAGPLERINRERPTCFAQSYSSKHLQERPLQTVRAIALQLFMQPDESDPTVYMNMQIETASRTYDAFMICDRQDGGLACAVECDGGQADLYIVKGSATNLQFVNRGFLMSGGCGPGQEEEVWLAPTQNGDDLFELEALPQAECK